MASFTKKVPTKFGKDLVGRSDTSIGSATQKNTQT